MDELSEIHGVLGSNTVAGWLKNTEIWGFQNLQNLKLCQSNTPPIEEKNQRKKRFKLDVHLRIGKLESDLETSQKKVHFYRYSILNLNILSAYKRTIQYIPYSIFVNLFILLVWVGYFLLNP